MSNALSGNQIARAAGLVMIGIVLSRLLGVVRETVLSATFGADRAYEAYALAQQPSETLFTVIAGGALASAFIPTFTDYLTKNSNSEAWRLANTVLNLLTIIMIVLAAVGAIFALPIAEVTLARGFDPENQRLTADLMRIMLLSPIIFGVSGLQMGILNTHQRFLLPALAPAMYNVGIIIGAVVFGPMIGIYGLAWGVVLGAALHWAVQLPGIWQIGLPYRPVIDTTHPGVWEILRLMGPRVLGLAVVQINFWVNKTLASGMVVGSVSALQRAWIIMLLPQGVIAQAVAIAAFPTFAAQVAEDNIEALRDTLTQVLEAVLFLAVPATVGLLVLRLPIVRVILEYGEFTRADSVATAWALLFFGLGLVSHSIVEIITRAFYAMHDTFTPVAIGGGAMLLNVVFSLTFIQFIGIPGSLVQGPFAGLALANTVATTIEAVGLLALIGPRVGGLDAKRLLIGLLRTSAASAVMGGLLWVTLPLIDQVGVIPGTLGAVAAGGVVFWAVAWGIGSTQARLFTRMALRQINRG